MRRKSQESVLLNMVDQWINVLGFRPFLLSKERGIMGF